MTSVLLLDSQTIGRLLTLTDCISAVEAAFDAYARGAALEHGLLHVDADRGEFHVKVGGLRSARTYFVAKINGGFFNNRAESGLPNIIGLILLCDGATGAPLAVLESGLITRLRTGAATAVAAKYLARPDSRTVTICGAGVQAEIQLRALKEVLPLEHAFVWSRRNAEQFAASLSSALGITTQAVSDLGEATFASDVVVTCTPAKRWFLGREHVRRGTFIAAVGTDSPEKQELEPELLAENCVVPDLLNQATHVGDLHRAIADGIMQPHQIRAELGAIIAGLAPGRTSHDEIVIFDSTGTALQDAAAAAVVYERARGRGLGTSFVFWN